MNYAKYVHNAVQKSPDNEVVLDDIYNRVMRGVTITTPNGPIDELITALIKRGIKEDIRQESRDLRGPLPTPGVVPPSTRAARNPAMAAAVHKQGLDIGFWYRHIIQGRYLGDCTPEDLLLASEHHKQNADGHMKRAEYYSQLAAQGVAGDSIKKHVKEKDAWKLWRKIVA